MGVRRRSLITSAVAGSAFAAISGTDLVHAAAAFGASPAGDVVGKITVGYQGWFACIGDGAPINGWWHWAANWGQTPSPTNNGTLRAWPYMNDYTSKYQTAYANLGNGQLATLFSSYDQQTVNAHFQSMQASNIDTAALQRFNPTGGEGPTRDAVTSRVRSAAETYGRKFYIMYDVTGWTNMQSEIKADWTNKMSAHTASSAYARQNGKPVVGIWGFGFNDNNHPWDAATCLDVINWFKGQGVYVMGGVPREWRTGVGGSRAGYSDVYHALNMLSPWMVGAIGNIGGSDDAYTNLTVPDQADCAAHGIDYQPCVLPGDVSGRQRVHGDFMWRQFYNMCRAGVAAIYISMFDEFNEGNQICKTAENQSQIPTNAGLLGLDEDGTVCSADYYLRLTGDGGRMLKGQIALTATRPTQPVAGGGGDTSAPSVPSGLVISGHTSSSATLTWSAAADNVAVTGYQIRQNGTVIATTAALTYTALNLLPSTVYSFAVAAYDAAGNVSAPSAAVAITTDPGGDNVNLALNRPTSESGHNQTYISGNAVDGNANSYWESVNSAFPQWIQVDLGASTTLGRVIMKLPPSWGARNQTVTVQGSTDGSSFTTLVPSASYGFDPSTANSVTVNVPASTARHVRLSFTANTGWPAGQLSEFEVYANTSGGDTTKPSAPGSLSVTAHTSTTVSLSWTAATDNVGVTGYQVRQSGSVVATVAGLAYTVTGLSPATAYSFTVTAIDAAGNTSNPSNAVNVTTDAAPNTNLARGKATLESSHVQTYVSSNAVDGDANSYWESNNNAFPQWIQVDLGASTAVSRLVLKLPPSTAWGARSQTLSVVGSLDGSNFSTLKSSTSYTFDPNSGGNSATITFASSSVRHVRLNITANTGWPAGQLSEFEIYAS